MRLLATTTDKKTTLFRKRQIVHTWLSIVSTPNSTDLLTKSTTHLITVYAL